MSARSGENFRQSSSHNFLLCKKLLLKMSLIIIIILLGLNHFFQIVNTFQCN